MERIELHAKTAMTALDGIADYRALIKAAMAKEQKAIAICDRNTVLTYPMLGKYIRSLASMSAEDGKEFNFKAIYGVEVSVRDDMANQGEPEYPGYFDYSVVLLLTAWNTAWNQENAIYRLLSEADEYGDNENPVIRKSDLAKQRKNVLIGATDDMGELWMALAFGEDEERIAEKMAFYDYVEIMPAEYLQHWIVQETGMCHSLEEIRERQQRLLAIAKRLGKPVVATNHPTLLTQQDWMMRKKLIHHYHDEKGDEDYPAFLLNTREMKEQFSYLDEETVETIVVANPNMIADRCSQCRQPDWQVQFPHDEALEHKLVARIADGANRLYGNDLSEAIRTRIHQEWKNLRKNERESVFGAVVKLCDYSKQRGYPVRVRGTLGNLVIAYLTGIVDDDPLQYQLPLEGYFGIDGNHFGEFELEFARELYDDLRDELATYFPDGLVVRGSAIKRLGSEEIWEMDDDIPIGKGMEPDRINKGWDRHSRVCIVPDRNSLYAYMPVRKHFDEAGCICNGLFSGLWVYDMDMYYSGVNLLSSRLLSLIGRLQCLTGKAWQDVPIQDQEVLRKVCQGDTKGIQGLNTPRMQELIAQLHPQTFGDLLKICALQHGTNVWENNQKFYFDRQEITLDTLIATREDVWDLCIRLGMDEKQAYRIMTKVRQGGVYREEDIKLLHEYGAPKWFMYCCTSDNSIGYLFPRAHCLNSLRWSLVALWYKLYYPQEFYQAYFDAYGDYVNDFNDYY